MKKRAPFLVLAGVLLALGVLFSRWTDVASAPESKGEVALAREKAKAVVYPRDTNASRRAALRAKSEQPSRPPRREAVHDPIQRAMNVPGGGAVFVEVNAIRHSELVERLLRCRGEEAGGELERMRDELGIDPLEDLDRVAMHQDVLAASGFLGDLKLPPAAGEALPYGDGAQLYEWPTGDEEQGGTAYLGRVGEDLLILAKSADDVKAAVDRVEGRGPPPEPLPAHLTGSEIYGRIGPELIQSLSGPGSDPLFGKLEELVEGGTARVLVDEHVSVSLDFEAKSPEDADDLAKALGGALAAVRQQAKGKGDEELAALLEQARVLPQGGGRFGVDVAVPGDLILKGMGCGPDGARTEPETEETEETEATEETEEAEEAGELAAP